METLWFCLYWAMISTFVVLGGTDIGVGILHVFVGKDDEERGQVIRSIRPVWKANEVWLVASGGTMILAFPKLMATSLSGFYLAFMLVLWLLIGRGLGMDYRHRVRDPMWRQFCDVAFCASSCLLALCLGAALGNFVRGVPFDEDGIFFEALWTNFRVGSQTGILDWYTVLVGMTAVVALAHHGALWLNAFTDGAVHDRSARLAGRLWFAVVGALIASATTSFALQSQVGVNATAHPWGVVFPLVAAAAMTGCWLLRVRGRALHAYVLSGVALYAMLASAAFGLYPYLLPGRQPERGLTAIAAAAPHSALQIALYWWIPGVLLACGYFVYVYSTLPATFSIGDEKERSESRQSY